MNIGEILILGLFILGFVIIGKYFADIARYEKEAEEIDKEPEITFATNGEAIMSAITSLYPNAKYRKGFIYSESRGKHRILFTIAEDWWNAPFKNNKT